MITYEFPKPLYFSQAAAEEIAEAMCPQYFDGAMFSIMGHTRPPDYQKACRTVAYGICKGRIGQQVRNNCGVELGTVELLEKQNECVDKINKMVNYRGNLRK